MTCCNPQDQPASQRPKPDQLKQTPGLLLHACSLAGAMCSAGPVRVTATCVIIPWEHVRLAIWQSMQAEMDAVIHHGAQVSCCWVICSMCTCMYDVLRAIITKTLPRLVHAKS